MKHPTEKTPSTSTASNSYHKILGHLLSEVALQDDEGKEAAVNVTEIEETSLIEELKILQSAFTTVLDATPLKGAFTFYSEQKTIPEKGICMEISLTVNPGYPYTIANLAPYKEKISDKALELTPEPCFLTPNSLFEQLFSKETLLANGNESLLILSDKAPQTLDIPTLILSLKVINGALQEVLVEHGYPEDSFKLLFGTFGDVISPFCGITNHDADNACYIALAAKGGEYTLKQLLPLQKQLSQYLRRWNSMQDLPECEAAHVLLSGLINNTKEAILSTLPAYVQKELNNKDIRGETRFCFGFSDRLTQRKAEKHKDIFNRVLQQVLKNHGIPSDTFFMETFVLDKRVVGRLSVKEGSDYSLDMLEEFILEILMTLKTQLFEAEAAKKQEQKHRQAIKQTWKKKDVSPKQPTEKKSGGLSQAIKPLRQRQRKNNKQQATTPLTNTVRNGEKEMPTSPSPQFRQNTTEIVDIHSFTAELCHIMSGLILKIDTTQNTVSFTLNSPNYDLNKLKKAMNLLKEKGQHVFNACGITEEDMTLKILKKQDGSAQVSLIRTNTSLSWSIIHSCLGKIEGNIRDTAPTHSMAASQAKAKSESKLPSSATSIEVAQMIIVNLLDDDYPNGHPTFSFPVTVQKLDLCREANVQLQAVLPVVCRAHGLEEDAFSITVKRGDNFTKKNTLFSNVSCQISVNPRYNRSIKDLRKYKTAICEALEQHGRALESKERHSNTPPSSPRKDTPHTQPKKAKKTSRKKKAPAAKPTPSPTCADNSHPHKVVDASHKIENAHASKLGDLAHSQMFELKSAGSPIERTVTIPLGIKENNQYSNELNRAKNIFNKMLPLVLKKHKLPDDAFRIKIVAEKGEFFLVLINNNPSKCPLDTLLPCIKEVTDTLSIPEQPPLSAAEKKSISSLASQLCKVLYQYVDEIDEDKNDFKALFNISKTVKNRSHLPHATELLLRTSQSVLTKHNISKKALTLTFVPEENGSISASLVRNDTTIPWKKVIQCLKEIQQLIETPSTESTKARKANQKVASAEKTSSPAKKTVRPAEAEKTRETTPKKHSDKENLPNGIIPLAEPQQPITKEKPLLEGRNKKNGIHPVTSPSIEQTAAMITTPTLASTEEIPSISPGKKKTSIIRQETTAQNTSQENATSSPEDPIDASFEETLKSFASRIEEPWEKALPASERIKPAFHLNKWKQLIEEQRASSANVSQRKGT